jgi:hypothetical protein
VRSRPAMSSRCWPNHGFGCGDLSLLGFGVDNIDAGGADGEVVGVRAAAGNAAVVQQDGGSVGGAALQRLGDRFLAELASPPRELVLRVGLQREAKAGRAWMAV